MHVWFVLYLWEILLYKNKTDRTYIGRITLRHGYVHCSGGITMLAPYCTWSMYSYIWYLHFLFVKFVNESQGLAAGIDLLVYPFF